MTVTVFYDYFFNYLMPCAIEIIMRESVTRTNDTAKIYTPIAKTEMPCLLDDYVIFHKRPTLQVQDLSNLSNE